MKIGSPLQGTDFALDVLGRYVCNTFDEALANSDPVYRAAAQLPARGDMRPFDFVVVGGGTFGAAIAEHLWFRSTGRSERILVLEASPFLLAEHMQNLPSLGLGREVWGLPWNSDAALNYSGAGLAYCGGGRSLWWGGWSPRLLDSEAPAAAWPRRCFRHQGAAPPDGSSSTSELNSTAKRDCGKSVERRRSCGGTSAARAACGRIARPDAAGLGSRAPWADALQRRGHDPRPAARAGAVWRDADPARAGGRAAAGARAGRIDATARAVPAGLRGTLRRVVTPQRTPQR
jgi:hypothetical protein